MNEDKRKYLRLPVETRTFIELEAPAAGSSIPGKLLTCKTLKISRGGLQLSLTEEVAVGAIFQIGVDLPGSTDTLYLAGEARWCSAHDEIQYPWTAGFKILNDNDSDIDRWIALLVSMEG